MRHAQLGVNVYLRMAQIVAGANQSARDAPSVDRFETHPDEINWNDVGTLNHYASLLRQGDFRWLASWLPA